MIALCLLAMLTGCVRLGSTNLLVTPVGVVGVHSFAPSAPRFPDAVSVRADPIPGADD